jgi:hypothetical protein
MRFVSIVTALFAGFTIQVEAQNYQGECLLDLEDYEAYSRQIVYVSIDGNGYENSGTASWLTDTKLVTIGHITDDIDVSKETWSEGRIRWGGVPYEAYEPYQQKEMAERTAEVKIRLLEAFPAIDGEYIIVLELENPAGEPSEILLPNPDTIWRQPRPGDPVFGVVFQGNGRFWPELRYAGGHVFQQFFAQSSSGEGKPLNPDLLWLEMITRPHPLRGRDVAKAGSSGFPIFNCDGELVGVTAYNLTQDTALGVLPTAWGVPNALGVRVSDRTAARLNEYYLHSSFLRGEM